MEYSDQLRSLLTCYVDQEPLPERRLVVWCSLPPLRLQGDALLHSDLRCQPWSGPARTANLGQGTGSSHRAAQVDQPAGHTGPGRRISVEGHRLVGEDVKLEVTNPMVGKCSHEFKHVCKQYQRGLVKGWMMRNQKARLDASAGGSRPTRSAPSQGRDAIARKPAR